MILLPPNSAHLAGHWVNGAHCNLPMPAVKVFNRETEAGEEYSVLSLRHGIFL